ncbi:MAG TPA: hypothetical protein VHF06_17685 [Pseudonocardiaceae bacterium]|nr:hypothetical protein [Pseudonocardiaceae bacterium]
MSGFVMTLRAQAEQAGDALEHAHRAGDDQQVHRHGARLLDLLDRAAAHGVDTTGWVPPDTVALADTAAGEGLAMTSTPRTRRIPTPRAQAATDTATESAVAVVGDGSAQPPVTPDGPDVSLGSRLDGDAAVIHARTGLSVRAVPLYACDTDDLTAQVRALTADAGAVFLTRTDQVRARTTQQALYDAGGPPVLTDADTTAITLTAALLTAIGRAGYQPAGSRVLVAGADSLPELCPLLVAAGVGDISSWTTDDAHAFPVRDLAGHATAVVDLTGTVEPPDRQPGWPAVITPDDAGMFRMLPAPGLMRALAGHQDATLDVDVSRAAALALAAATPPDRPIPDPADPDLAEAIGVAVLRVLARRPPARALR